MARFIRAHMLSIVFFFCKSHTINDITPLKRWFVVFFFFFFVVIAYSPTIWRQNRWTNKTEMCVPWISLLKNNWQNQKKKINYWIQITNYHFQLNCKWMGKVHSSHCIIFILHKFLNCKHRLITNRIHLDFIH